MNRRKHDRLRLLILIKRQAIRIAPTSSDVRLQCFFRFCLQLRRFKLHRLSRFGKRSNVLAVQRLACLKSQPPPANEIKTGDQAANNGGRVPLTPRELKLKLNT